VTLLFTESQIDKLFVSNREEAIRKLSELQIYSGKTPTFTGLGGWVYEQTLHYCIKREMQRLKIKAAISEQVTFHSRVKADLTVGKVAVEIKSRGLFDSTSAAKYGAYAKAAKEKGYKYLFVTRQENYKRYKTAIMREIGRQNTFFLNVDGDWKRFIERLVELLA
jgi:hypothetical protein